ncbi:phosphate signaling complex protein PhoU [Ornithinibacillus halophilus]|uniref:Phosphate-specific transport system accessory protein PhoU n=1 Tax=Ornithinibacillus halophilus TaxID=930117 RepID=A0A1M5D2P3_9BACI|nr:phosphate signaling complex protein PhoU [Ornithinibacillus halophilus]SHF61208.1 phosphate transport system protein [Ornithinibacillus halophilus]
MTIRGQFHNQLDEIKQDIVDLANISEKALRVAIDALYNQDVSLANEVITNDKVIDKKEMEINDKTTLLIAKQQPVATDLRRLIIALRIVTDIERMGDNAKNIAKATIHLGEDNLIKIPEDLKQMRDLTLQMLDTAMNAFKYEDISVARKLPELDDKVDKLYKTIVTELLSETATDPNEIQYVMQIAFTARYLERFADHITNIGESILFLVKGENVNLNY